MNFGGDAALDLAAELATQERDAGIASARAALSKSGREECVDCGCSISIARRRVYPSATRCLECQQIAEKEASQK